MVKCAWVKGTEYPFAKEANLKRVRDLFSFLRSICLSWFTSCFGFGLLESSAQLRAFGLFRCHLTFSTFHKPCIMSLSFRLPCCCVIFFICGFNFSCPIWLFPFLFSPLQCLAGNYNHQFANFEAAMLPASWSSFSSSCHHQICVIQLFFAAKVLGSHFREMAEANSHQSQSDECGAIITACINFNAKTLELLLHNFNLLPRLQYIK